MGETKAAYSVDLIVQSVPATYGDTLVPIQVFINNEGFDTIAGYSLFINTGIPDLIDLVDTVDTAATLTSGFCFNSFIAYGDTAYTGDSIHIVAHNLDSAACGGKFIYPQTTGLLFTMYVNVAKNCDFIADTSSALIQIVQVISNVSDKYGRPIPTPGQTSADSLYFINGFVDIPGTLNIGDVNGSCNGQGPCTPNLADVIHLVNFIFDKDRFATGCLGSSPGNCWPPCPPEAGDINCGGITLTDVIHLVNYVFDKSRPATGCAGSDPGNCWTPVACP